MIGLWQLEEEKHKDSANVQMLSDQIANLSELLESLRHEQMMMASCSMEGRLPQTPPPDDLKPVVVRDDGP